MHIDITTTKAAMPPSQKTSLRNPSWTTQSQIMPNANNQTMTHSFYPEAKPSAQCSTEARNLSQFGLNSHYGRSINENAPRRESRSVDFSCYRNWEIRHDWPDAIMPPSQAQNNSSPSETRKIWSKPARLSKNGYRGLCCPLTPRLNGIELVPLCINQEGKWISYALGLLWCIANSVVLTSSFAILIVSLFRSILTDAIIGKLAQHQHVFTKTLLETQITKEQSVNSWQIIENAKPKHCTPRNSESSNTRSGKGIGKPNAVRISICTWIENLGENWTTTNLVTG